MNETCKTCRFYEIYRDGKTGECNRINMGASGDDPPFIKVDVLDDSGLWAILVVSNNFNCGNYWPSYVNGKITEKN